MKNDKLICSIMLAIFTVFTGFYSHAAYAAVTMPQESQCKLPLASEISIVEIMTVEESEPIIEEPVIEPQAISADFDILTPCGYTKEQLESALTSDSHRHMLPHIDALLKAEETYGVNAFYLLCKFGFESGWGRYMSGANNIGGWTGSDGSYRDFDSVEECIMHIAKALSTSYKDAVGSRLEDVCRRYCPTDEYLNTLMGIMAQRKNAIEGIDI